MSFAGDVCRLCACPKQEPSPVFAGPLPHLQGVRTPPQRDNVLKLQSYSKMVAPGGLRGKALAKNGKMGKERGRPRSEAQLKSRRNRRPGERDVQANTHAQRDRHVSVHLTLSEGEGRGATHAWLRAR